MAKPLVPDGDRNPQEECLWQDMPFCVHILPDGTPVRYGLSRGQAKGFPKRELWYVVIGLGDQNYTDWINSPYSAFVVDKICVEPEFMDKMGSDPERWRLICWEAPVGIEPWDVQIDDSDVADPFFVFKRDEAKLKRPWWRKLIGAVFPEIERREDSMEALLRRGDTREEFK